MKRWRLISLICLVVPAVAKTTHLADKAWVIIRPVQCLGNPWEKQWLTEHKNKADKFPRNRQFRLMRNYFAKKGIPILEMRVKTYKQGDPVCQACECPRGDEVYVMIQADDAPKMVNLGYTERVPAEQIPDKKKKK
jgi:hypothetical protein